jgi:Flp pilus assembly pilin Flp
MTRRAQLARDESGVTIVEFAMILPALCLLLVGFFELGYRSYATSIVQGALHEAARMATVGAVPMEDIDARVRTRLSDFAKQGTVDIDTTSYYEFSGVAMPETISSDTAPIGVYNEGDCFMDANGNETYDLDRGASGSLGGAEDIVRYEVTLTIPMILPAGSLMGWADNHVIRANTVLRNQPYGGRNVVIAQICPEEES